MSTIAFTVADFDPRPLPAAIDTMADVIARLGGIPPDRILMSPTPGTATEDDVVRFKLCELIDGTIVRKAMGIFESALGLMLGHVLLDFLDANPLGFAVGADCHIRFGDQIREPDVAFVSWTKSPDGVPDTAIGEVVPDLAVEILSRSNTKAEMERKRRVYFAHGVRLVWIAEPRKRIVEVWSDPDSCRILTDSDVLDGGEVLPGFRLSIREWFERTEQRMRKRKT